jgi:hypothetical protein
MKSIQFSQSFDFTMVPFEFATVWQGTAHLACPSCSGCLRSLIPLRSPPVHPCRCQGTRTWRDGRIEKGMRASQGGVFYGRLENIGKSARRGMVVFLIGSVIPKGIGERRLGEAVSSFLCATSGQGFFHVAQTP